MPYATTDEISLYYEDTASGTPIVFVHEFGSDIRGWELQVRHFSRQWRCIAYNARGYPPSDVPDQDECYGYEHAAEDIGAILDHLALDRAFIVGISMGAVAGLHFALRHPQRVIGLVLGGVAAGSEPATAAHFIADSLRSADLLLAQGTSALVEGMPYSAARVQFLAKDPRGWEAFRQQLADHSAIGSALTLRNYQARRPPVQALEAQLRTCTVPTLIIAGDEDDMVLEPSLYLKRTMPHAGLSVLPRSGHAVNLEEPAVFNRLVEDFFGSVERGRWTARDPRAKPMQSALTAQ